MEIIKIQEEYFRLTDENKLRILWSALDHMQSYNGRTRWDCIALAMGYDSSDGENYEKLTF